jgi:asparagine synthase (glutamine-hydrolysing)
MCGISAVIDRRGSPDAIARVRRMHEPIRHRGPDGEGFLTVDRQFAPRVVHRAAEIEPRDAIAAIAFRRLNVIDLSDDASQPMGSPDGSIFIAFNGEIYNFRTLRDQLKGAGREFRTHSDTEVALAAYETWGSGCFERLDGMWGIVIVDLRRRLVVISRDRFGIKPLFWAVEGERLLLASEAKQILAARDAKPHANAAMVAAFLRGRRVPALDETFFDGVLPLPPSTYAEIPLHAGSLVPVPVRYWDFSSIHSREISEREYPRWRDEFESVFRRAVETHMVADVNVGFLLSGGLDSSSLTAIMTDQARSAGVAPAPTFSFGFRDAAPQICEMPYVDSVVRRLRLSNHETTFDAAWVEANAGRVMHASEEPALALPPLAQYRVFELCRAHGMTVVVDGEGSDEILGGYPYYHRDLLIDRAMHGRIWSFASELHQMARRYGRTSPSIVNQFFVQPALRRPKQISFPWVDPSYGARNGSMLVEARVAATETGGHDSRVNARLFRDVRWGNAKIVLSHTDRIAMAHSIEARVPFFDLDLMRLAFSLPDHFKVGHGEWKRILRDMGRRYLPPEVTERKERMGFGTPDGEMVRGALWPDIEKRIRDAGVIGGAMFTSRLPQFIDAFRAGTHDDFRAIWRVYALARWSEEFGVSLR